MNSDSSKQVPNPKRLKTLAFDVRYATGNNILHQFVQDNSDPNNSVRENCINAVLVAMKGSGVDVNALNNDGYSPLHLAVLKHNLLMVKKLFSCRVNIDVNAICDDFHNNTALHLAVKSGDLATVEFLVSQGADVNAKDRFGWTPLHLAALSGNLDIIKFLLDSGVNVNIEREIACELLLCAAQSGDLGTIQFLIGKGADVNAKEESRNRTPLHYAVDTENLEAIKCLVDKGADVDATDLNGQAPLHLLQVIFNCSSDPYDNNGIGNKPDIEPDDMNKGLKKIQLLLEANADVNIKDKYGNTPLRYAMDFTHSDIVKLFLERDVDLNVKYSHDDTILHRACMGSDKLEIIEILLTKGCDVNAKNEFGKTPLHAAVSRNHADYIQLLVERGASVHVADTEGWTPLHWAAYKGHVEVVRALLDHGADRNAINEDGKTPLDLARENKLQLCINALQ